MKSFITILLLILLSHIYVLANIQVLVLAGNTAQAEFPVLKKFTKIGKQKVIYKETKDRALATNLNNYDILWLGQGEICEGAYFFKKETETRILNFAENGGIVISIGQDSDDARPCESGWFPKDITGIERGDTQAYEITKAKEVGSLFTKPNKVDQIHFDDAWTKPDKSIILLATINGGADVGVGLLHHGKGAYILTSIENEDVGQVDANSAALENLIHYAVNLMSTLVVDPLDKLTTSWGHVKTLY